MSTLQVTALSKSFARRGLPEVRVLEGLGLSAESGQTIAITGRSGSGKSTLLHVLGGMLAPDAGTVIIAGVEPWSLPPRERAAWRNARVGFVFQASRLLGELSALENVMAPAWIAGGGGERVRADAEALLVRLGLADRLHHAPSELSGGEAQRVAIARALVRGPHLVLADEPTGNLDREAGRRVFEELLALHREAGVVALVATHDLELAGRCDCVLDLSDGQAVTIG